MSYDDKVQHLSDRMTAMELKIDRTVGKLEQILLDTIHKLRYRGEHLFAEEIENRLKTVLGEKL